MTAFDYNPSTRVLFGPGKLGALADCVQELDKRRALLVSDNHLMAAGHVERAADILSRVIEVSVFSEVAENPSSEDIERGVEFAKDKGPFDLIVGLGGGSSMDCAKGINFVLTNGGRIDDYWGFGKAMQPMLPAIGIPTTAGTGSEAQSFALISQNKTKIKMACGDLKARFTVVILDPDLLQTVPHRVRAAAGIDAISHVVESFVCTKRSTLSMMFGKEAWRLLVQNYAVSLPEQADVETLGNMLLGSYFAGVAIENSMLGAAHACANPLSARFGLTHGVSVGLMLPHVIRFNESEQDLYSELLEISNAFAGKNQLRGSMDKVIEEILECAGLENRLRNLDIPEAALPDLAKDAAKQWTGGFNPRKVGEKEFLNLYQEAY